MYPAVLLKMSLTVYVKYTNNYENSIFSSIFCICKIFEIIKLFITLVYDLFFNAIVIMNGSCIIVI